MSLRFFSIGAGLLALSACDGEQSEPPVGIVPVAEAQELFIRHCAICHGIGGGGNGLRRKSLQEKPPDFRALRWRSTATPQTVRDAIRDGVPGTDMPAWKSLTDAQIAGLAQYVLSLGPANRK